MAIRSGVLISELFQTIVLAAILQGHRRHVWEADDERARSDIIDSLRRMLNDDLLAQLIGKLPQSTVNRDAAAEFIIQETIPAFADLLVRLRSDEDDVGLATEGIFNVLLSPTLRGLLLVSVLGTAFSFSVSFSSVSGLLLCLFLFGGHFLVGGTKPVSGSALAACVAPRGTRPAP